MKKLALVVAFLILTQIACAQELSPVTIQEINVKATVTANGTVSGNVNGKITIKVLSFQETEEQKINSLRQVLEINGKEIEAGSEEDDFGNRYAVFEFQETGRFTYLIEAEISKKVGVRALEDYNLSQEITEFESFKNPSENIESTNASIRTLALNRFDSNSWIETIAEVAEWVHNYVEYNISYYPEVYSAVETLENKEGTCDEFAVLTAAILRAKGIPTRVIAGPVFSAKEWNFHGWVEAFNPNTGWHPIDSTYGEAGIVDATHIEMGRFPDFADAKDNITGPTTAKITVEPKTIGIDLLDSASFSGLASIDANKAIIFANRWQDINITVKNLLDSYLILPIEMVKITDFIFEDRKKVLVFEPNEKKVVSWKTIVLRDDLEKGSQLTGKYVIISMHPRVEAELKVLPRASKEEASIQVKDVYAIVEGNELKITVDLENRGGETASAVLSISSGGTELLSRKEKIDAFSAKSLLLSIRNYKTEPYTVRIVSGELDYTATIKPEESILTPANDNPEEIWVATNGAEKANLWEKIWEEYGTRIVVAIAIIVIIAILLKKLVFK